MKDQYRKEVRIEMKKGPSFKSSWDLYEPLSFIKTQFKSHLVAQGEFDISCLNYNYQDVSIENNPIVVFEDEPEDITVDIDVNTEFDDDETETQEIYSSSSDSDLDNDSAIILTEAEQPEIKKIKLSNVYSLNNTNEDSNDVASEQFFKSLVPFMMQMTDIQKLRVRNTIQNVILHELQNN